MSVFVILQFKADGDRLLQALNSDPGRLETINQRAKGLGALHHSFVVSAEGGEVAVWDEWETAEGFQKFFAESDDIREMMGEVGVTSEPQVSFWNRLDTPDAF
jgi:hypothetical protein